MVRGKVAAKSHCVWCGTPAMSRHRRSMSNASALPSPCVRNMNSVIHMYRSGERTSVQDAPVFYASLV